MKCNCTNCRCKFCECDTKHRIWSEDGVALKRCVRCGRKTEDEEQ